MDEDDCGGRSDHRGANNHQLVLTCKIRVKIKT